MPDILTMLAYIVISIVSGILSCFVLWSKMANYSDGASHAGVLGCALAVALGVGVTPMICCAIALFAVTSYFFSLISRQTYDTIVAVVSRGMAAVGIVLMVYFVGEHEIGHEVGEVFFGAGHRMSAGKLLVAYVYSIAAAALVLLRHKQWILAMINEDLAQVEGVSVYRVRLEILLAVTVYIMLLMDTVGMIMISATLITPAVAARYLSRDYMSMIVVAVILNVLAALFGYGISFAYEVPVGAAIVSVLFVVFIVAGALRVMRVGVGRSY